MKAKAREEARRLRIENGLSIVEIARRVGVSKGTTSVWLRDIVLTDEQKQRLSDRNPAFANQTLGSVRNQEKQKLCREKYQEEGATRAREGNILHAIGCMLYWGEGAKDKNQVGFSNSDPNMHKIFLRFLRDCYGVADEDIAIAIHCYNDLHSVEDIEQYWVDTLGVSKSCLRKTMVNKRPISSQKLGRKLGYGTCNIRVCRTELVQSIFGAIREYAGIKESYWID
jgi:transposase-like protein